MLKVLKFRYFLLAFLLIGCGELPEKKQKDAATEEISVPQNEVIDTDQKIILFYGNSLTAAYGLDTKEGFPNRIQQRLDSLGLE